MGSRLILHVANASATDANAAWAAATTEMARADADLSRFRSESDLSRLNAVAGAAQLRPVSARLRRMLTLARRAQRVTGGRFDCRTVVALEGLGERAQVQYARVRVPVARDVAWLHRCGRGLMGIDDPVDSGGIGKGLGLRWSLAAARRAATAADGLLLDAGGDVTASGRAPDGHPWLVGIEDPERASAPPLAVVMLDDGALATSSIAVRSWTSPSGARVHHLIDPSTWQPAAGGLRAVTVAHRDPAWAEVWSKAYFVAGAAAIGAEARARGMPAWWVEDDGSFHMTPAARHLTAWQRDL